jgi:hypothetical protein
LGTEDIRAKRKEEIALMCREKAIEENNGRDLLSTDCAMAYLGLGNSIPADDLDTIVRMIVNVGGTLRLSSDELLKLQLLRKVLGKTQMINQANVTECKAFAEQEPVDGRIEMILNDCVLLRTMGIPFKVHVDLWKKGRILLQKITREEHWHAVSHLAASMAVIAADDVKMTENGLQITHRGREKSPGVVQPFPETLRFLQRSRI